MRLLPAVASSVLILVVPSMAQWHERPMTGSRPETLVDRTKIAGQSGLGPMMTAQLLDKDANATQHRAIIQIQTDGVQIIDPSAAQYAPTINQAHIQYRLDNGAVVNTTSLRIELDGLSPGDHRIQVALAGNDNKPIGHQTTLNLHVPKA